MSRRRVVVTGCGGLTALGHDWPTIRAAMRDNRTGIVYMTEWDSYRELNTRLGASYVRWLELYYDGDLEKMLIAYNAGPGRLKKWSQEAGSYEAWYQTRVEAEHSPVLAYVRLVTHYRDRFARRGVILPPGTMLPEKPRVKNGIVHPPRPDAKPDAR